MRVTFVLPTLDLSGGCRVVSMYARGLLDLGHVVTVIVPKTRRRTFRQLIGDAFRHRRLIARQPSVKRSHFKDINVDVRVINYKSVATGSAFPAADILVATWWETMEWVNSAAARCGIKTYFIQHHELFEGLPLQRVRATYLLPSKKITISRWIADILSDEYKITDIEIIPNAVDHNVFTSGMRQKNERKTIGFVYSRTGFKGAEVALDAIRAIKLARPDVQVVAFGCEIFHQDFPKYIDLQVEPDQALIPKIYRSCDAWICSSHAEGFNLPAMEAMACGTPVVSTRTGWPLEAIIDGENGYTVEPGDSLALGRRVLEILAMNGEAWSKMSSAAQATARAQSWQRSIAALEATFNRVVSQR